MSDERNPCEALGPEVTALIRGDLSPAEEAPVRAHLASCPDCAALAEDLLRLFSASAARPSPIPDAASRSRLAVALDAAWEEEEERLRMRGPVLRLLDRAGRRYAESRTVRFLAYSVAAHAAAAVLLGIYLGVVPKAESRPEPGFIEVSRVDTLPRDEYDPLTGVPPEAHPASRDLPGTRFVDIPWTVPGPFSGGLEPTRPVEDPPDLDSPLRLYPNSEFRSFAGPRFHASLRAERLARAWGPEQGPRAALTVERGLRWLTAAQEEDGTWPSGRPGDPKAQQDRFRGGVTAMVVMAYLGDGRTAMRPGPYAATVRLALQALVWSQDASSGLLGGFAKGPAGDRPLCNHGPALAAVAEAYGLDYGRLPASTRGEMARAVDRAVAATLAAQLEDGSFGYAPGARQGDASVTLLQVEGLEAARRAGFAVDPAALRRAGEWLSARIAPDGRLGYRERGDRALDATLTAEALPSAAALGMPAAIRERMTGAVLAEARGADLAGRVLFRSALLEAAAADPAGLPLGPEAARAALDVQTLPGSFLSAADRYARPAGDALATARTLRALTAPYRVAP